VDEHSDEETVMGASDILTKPPMVANARLSYGDHPDQCGDLWLPPGDGPHPVALLIHGGFWRARYDRGYLGHLAAALRGLGVATWNIEYRRVGQTGGGWTGTFEDIAAAAAYLRILTERYSLDLRRVVAVGHSAGGHLALWLAARAGRRPDEAIWVESRLPLKKVIALAGIGDLRQAWDLGLSNHAVGELLGGSPLAVPQRYAVASPADLLPLGTAQTLIHGDAADDVPLALSQRYAALARQAGDDVDLIVLPGLGHFELVDPTSAAWPTVSQVILSALSGEGQPT